MRTKQFKLFGRENAHAHVPFNYWLGLLLVLLATKVFLYILDPNPMFYMGDSGAYIGTALNGYLPLDRSFVYGLVIRYTAVLAHSISSLLALQLLSGVISIMCLAIVLIRYFNVSRSLVALISVVACVEPLQFMMERYVMTETLALTFFALFVLFLLAYISRPTATKVLLIQVSGILLISMRISYLPIVQVFTLLAPFLAYLEHRGSDSLNKKRYLAHFLLSCVLFGFLHTGYKSWMGYLHGQAPSYQYADGLFLLSAFSPLLKPTDFTDPLFGERLIKGLELKSLGQRDAHRWKEGMMTQRLLSEVGDKYEANRIALAAAHNIVKRDIIGPIYLGFRTWLEFYDLENVRARATWDRGFPLPQGFLEITRKHFGLYADNLVRLNTLSGAMWKHATYWYVFLASLPFFFLLLIPFGFARNSRIFALWVITCGLVAAATIPVTISSIRYLHPLGWLGILVLAILFQQMLIVMRQNKDKNRDHEL